jgi:hypothetical protein
LHAHRGGSERSRANQIADEFAARAGYRVVKSTTKHRQFQIERC